MTTAQTVSSGGRARPAASASRAASRGASVAAWAASPPRRAVAAAMRTAAASSCTAFHRWPAVVRGTPPASVWATPARMPPCCTRMSIVMTAQAQKIQPRPASRGPGTASNDSSGVRPHVSVVRPISIWAATLIAQPSTMSHRSANPASAPTVVAAISSPDPTMALASTIPGPRCTSDPRSVRGGSSVGAEEIAMGQIRELRGDAILTWGPASCREFDLRSSHA